MAKRKKAAPRKNLHYFLLKVAENTVVKLPVRCSNAKSTVTLDRKLGDLLAGDEGLAITCANAQCALRLAEKAFPHPVYLAEFTDKRAYIVDRLSPQGVPSHCVVYHHEQGNFQKEYDTKGKNRLAKMSGVEKTFRLIPPFFTAAPGHGTSPDRDHSGSTGASRERKRHAKAKRGATARVIRARRAGVNIPLPASLSA